jgi:hypothetical protein
MKKIASLSLLICLITACAAEKTIYIKVENPSDFDRLTEMVEIPINDLFARFIVVKRSGIKIALSKGQTFVLRNDRREIVPSQMTYDGKFIFQAGTKAKESVTYTLTAGRPRAFAPKTYARFVTERKDDFAWENDRVAFRIYGPALIPVDGPSNGLDFWYKRTDKLIIDRWYEDDLAGVRSYHDDHGEGLDDYKVGRTLGGGMMAPCAGDTLWLNENFVRQSVFENGPLRTTFKLTYKELDVDGKTVSESRTFSLDAGSQLTKVTQEYGTDDTFPVAACIVKREGSDAFLTDRTDSGIATIVYAEPPSDRVGNVYVGMVFPDGLVNTATNSYTLTHRITGKEETHSHIMGITLYEPGKPVSYYTGFGWSKYGFPAADDFPAYIKRFALSLENPLIVTY